MLRKIGKTFKDCFQDTVLTISFYLIKSTYNILEILIRKNKMELKLKIYGFNLSLQTSKDSPLTIQKAINTSENKMYELENGSRVYLKHVTTETDFVSGELFLLKKENLKFANDNNDDIKIKTLNEITPDFDSSCFTNSFVYHINTKTLFMEINKNTAGYITFNAFLNTNGGLDVVDRIEILPSIYKKENIDIKKIKSIKSFSMKVVKQYETPASITENNNEIHKKITELTNLSGIKTLYINGKTDDSLSMKFLDLCTNKEHYKDIEDIQIKGKKEKEGNKDEFGESVDLENFVVEIIERQIQEHIKIQENNNNHNHKKEKIKEILINFLKKDERI